MHTADLILNLWILFSHMEQIHYKEQTVDADVFRKHNRHKYFMLNYILDSLFHSFIHSLTFLDCQYHFTPAVLKTLCIDYILWFLANQQISPVTKIHFAELINLILYVRFEVVTVVHVKYVIFWDVMPHIL